MTLKNTFGEYSFVSKVDVTDLEASVKWYKDKLGLVLESKYDTPSWRQFSIPDIERFAIGLNLSNSVVAGSTVSTFVVKDIVAARQSLIEKGVEVGPITDVGHGVQLSVFKDIDGNLLGLRQNPQS
ncbi:VOC family protein [Nostoc sp. 'Lobaria pulmonaria (5183) cyanobiont']|uniref:VOC family protein n=1 Tax=Nostoc sp. 'Lobaria pulmonaria (5183) cyanobiont' TaxID=1618022 RepID=UPI000CF323CC|nr:VOC family protein [Nostoc sp. 'Lobaria pulmonaria (5183) cyanobiont']AVH73050.1 glyoxalase/bleomycin resistance protein/dioxygenase [Nostoc sp. 'Lobaria pulmonaria (5183) cyanobiont']